MKIELMRPKADRFIWRPQCHRIVTLTKSAPFIVKSAGEYIHRVRSASAHIRNEEYSHTSFKLWCGQIAFMDSKRKDRLVFEVPTGGIVCATCEGRAIGSGQLGSPVISGRAVKFSPKQDPARPVPNARNEDGGDAP